MGELHQSVLVRAPLEQAVHSLSAYVAAHTNPQQHAARVTLRLPILVARLELAHEVSFSLRHAHRYENERQVLFDVDWEVETEIPIPHFSGRLSAKPELNPSIYSLLLDGSYHPPYGAFGKLLDATLGHLMVELTAKNLLERMKGLLEAKNMEGSYSHAMASAQL